MIPDNVYICADGHVTQADDWDYRNALVEKPAYDYTKHCRRWCAGARCTLPVVAAAQVPHAYAAFLIGGEPAVREIMIQVANGDTQT